MDTVLLLIESLRSTTWPALRRGLTDFRSGMPANNLIKVINV